MSFFTILKKAFSDPQYVQRSKLKRSKQQMDRLKRRDKYLRRRKTSKGENFSDRPSSYKRTHLGQQ